jgi:flagellar basal-body rod protein FlgB
MDFNQIPIFNVMKAKLNYMSARQGVLAQNVANADTPEYQARDIAQPDFRKMVGAAGGKLPMIATNTKHIVPAGGVSAAFAVEKRKLTDERNPTGNNVVIEEEMMKVAENQAEYQKVLNIYRKSVDLFKVALGRPSGGA